MKKAVRWISGFFVLVLLLSLSASALADDGYSYTVRIYSGAQGTFGGSQVLTFTFTDADLSGAPRISFSPGWVTLNDGSKYYVRGIRESGKDNNTVRSSFPVTRDQDYVVAYGILGSSVAYTIHYVDAAGRTLAPSETYYGNVGDKPVVAYQYIEGYQPQYYNLTRTLSDDASENVFTFVYTLTPQPTPVPQNQGQNGQNQNNQNQNNQNQNNQNQNNQNQNNQNQNNQNQNNQNQDPNGQNQNGQDSNAQGQPSGAGTEGQTGGPDATPAPETTAQPSGPEEILDLDVPLAGPDSAGSTSAEQSSRVVSRLWLIIGAVAAFGLIALLLWYLLVFRRREDDDDA